MTAKPALIEAPTDFPTGLAVSTDKGVYFIKGKTRFKFVSERAYQSWKITTVNATFAAIKHLVNGGGLGFRDGTLLKNVADGKMYLISGNRKRHIISPDAFDRYGLDINDAVLVADEEVKVHQEGDVLS